MTTNAPIGAGFHSRLIETRFGRIALFDTDPKGEAPGVPLLFVHGNSTSRKIFRAQLSGGFAQHRVLAADLLGHGDSDDAIDPFVAYTHQGYADTLIEVLGSLGIKRIAVVGWSLGGYIGYELAAKFPGVAALVTTGTPPVNEKTLSAGFLDNPTFEYVGREKLTPAQAREMAEQSTVVPAPPEVLADAVRADGRARKRMFESVVAGEGVDKRQLAITPPVPLAIIDGADDPFVNREHVDALPFSALWRSAVVRIPGARHAAFFEEPSRFNELVRLFLADHNL
ncbi:alpha/beta fold hydrolase [Streptomyces paromomycinus]|uniref:Putative hydrolase n=1 Tax=Streptomyces paromomycinus TaxID=92743 RepID=A0A401W2B9_STREY|nr:alpha/beta hydrolase [Streptomyces paromomycinus]GCD43432.1 putative hydrolase [Streptomyces paromomycinus]